MFNHLWGRTMIEEIMHLLLERNRHLKQFASLNTNQIEKIRSKDFENINDFYTNRENLLLVIEKIENLINEKLENKNINFSNQNKLDINKIFSEKDEIIKGILNQDLEILSFIDNEKNNLISQLKVTQKNKKTLSAYKSGNKNSKISEKY